MASILEGLSFESKNWLDLSSHLMKPLVVLSPNSLGKEETLEILANNHYSPNYDLLYYTELATDDSPARKILAPHLGSAEIQKALTAIDHLLSISSGDPSNPNGVFILIRAPGVATMLHKHTLDVIQNAGPQRVYWWSKSKNLPKFWFESEGETILWPTSLNETNCYELDTKTAHAGEATSDFTIFFITFGRTFKD